MPDSSEPGETGGKSATGETDDGSKSEVLELRVVPVRVYCLSRSQFTRVLLLALAARHSTTNRHE